MDRRNESSLRTHSSFVWTSCSPTIKFINKRSVVWFRPFLNHTRRCVPICTDSLGRRNHNFFGRRRKPRIPIVPLYKRNRSFPCLKNIPFLRWSRLGRRRNLHGFEWHGSHIVCISRGGRLVPRL